MSLTVYPEVQQGTPEWHDQRRGLVTASVVGKLISIGPPAAWTVDCPACKAQAGGPCVSMAAKKAPTAIKTLHDARLSAAGDLPPVYSVADNETSRGLTDTLVAERLSGWTDETPMTSDMWRGVEIEPFARERYAEIHGPVAEVGFMRHDGNGWSLGYSPDGLVGDDGLIEIKAPRTKGHVRTVISGEVPAYYMPQLQAGLLVSGRAWIDFVPYVAGMPLWVKRVYPDPAWHEAIKAACITFEAKAAEMVAAYLQATENLPRTERLDLEIVI